MGHTKTLFEETMNLIRDTGTIALLSNGSSQITPSSSVHRILTALYPAFQRVFERCGVHILKKATFQDTLQESVWSCRTFNLPFYLLLLENSESFDQVYEWLADEHSRRVFDWFVQVHMSGLFLGRFTPKIFPFVERGEAPTHPPIAVKRRGFFRYRYFVDKYQFHCSEPVIEPVFLRRDYAYRDIVLPSSGESIVEGGGYYGETALWFSDAVGPAGHVWSFEPDAHSYRMLCENMARNRLKNVTPVPVGLWDTEGQIGFRSQASASRAAEGDCAKPVPVITLDRLVERERLEKVDYIKLDIEGAERRALLGMEHTIRYFRPKLAICVYHLFDDIIAIPRLVKELCPDYVLYLDHKSDTLSETVLFALPRTRAELSGGA